MNKRLLCLLLAAMLLLGCTACGQRAEPPAVAPTRTPAPSEAPAVEETPVPTEEPAPTPEPEAAEKVIRLFETSDIHGYLLDTSGGEESEFQYRMAYIADKVKARWKALSSSGVLTDTTTQVVNDCYSLMKDLGSKEAWKSDKAKDICDFINGRIKWLDKQWL